MAVSKTSNSKKIDIGSRVRLKDPKWFSENSQDLEYAMWGNYYVFAMTEDEILSPRNLRVYANLVTYLQGKELTVKSVGMYLDSKVYDLVPEEWNAYNKRLQDAMFTEEMLELV